MMPFLRARSVPRGLREKMTPGDLAAGQQVDNLRQGGVCGEKLRTSGPGAESRGYGVMYSPTRKPFSSRIVARSDPGERKLRSLKIMRGRGPALLGRESLHPPGDEMDGAVLV